MKVKIISHTANPELVIATAAKLCYAGCTIDELMEKQTEEGIKKFIKRLMDMGHESPLEHVSFTFAIEGVSRITEQQLTRHRIASYSIQSGRYVTRENAEFFIPLVIEKDESAKSVYTEACKKAKEDYKTLETLIEFELCTQECEKRKLKRTTADPVEDLKKVDIEAYKDIHKIAIENARCVFPNSLETRIICTMNARSLLNFFAHRCCFRAQKEIRDMANEMLKLVKEIAPTLFKHAGANCVTLGYCPEGSMQCNELKGKKPTLQELFDAYNLVKKMYKEN